MTTSAIAENAYIATRQTGAALNTMVVLQAYQEEMLERGWLASPPNGLFEEAISVLIEKCEATQKQSAA